MHKADQYGCAMDFAKLWDGFEVVGVNMGFERIHSGYHRAAQDEGQDGDDGGTYGEPRAVGECVTQRGRRADEYGHQVVGIEKTSDEV